MANIKSQIKRNRQTERRNERNKAVRSRLKTEVKRTRTAAESGDAETAATEYRAVARSLDKASSGGTIHKRTAARRKSRLAKQINRSAAS